MGSGLKAENMTGIRARERAQGSEEWDQGSQGFWALIRETESDLYSTESDLYIFFARNGEEEKGQKEILWQSKVCKYFLDLLLARVLA